MVAMAATIAIVVRIEIWIALMTMVEMMKVMAWVMAMWTTTKIKIWTEVDGVGRYWYKTIRHRRYLWVHMFVGNTLAIDVTYERHRFLT